MVGIVLLVTTLLIWWLTPTDEVEVMQLEPSKQVELSASPTTATTTDVVLEKHTFRVTAYCSCVKCCGKWAYNRPLDENGNPIVIGASGGVLIPMVSVASPLPFGTEIELDGIGTVVVHDRTAQWIVDKHGQYILDLYFNDHQKALEFGVKQLEGAIKKMIGDHPEIVWCERTGYPSYNQPILLYCDECGRDITDETVYDDECHTVLCERCLLKLHEKEWW